LRGDTTKERTEPPPESKGKMKTLLFLSTWILIIALLVILNVRSVIAKEILSWVGLIAVVLAIGEHLFYKR
jgi:1,4-dihydroxy-2-naphthoate octaprenyltransferase